MAEPALGLLDREPAAIGSPQLSALIDEIDAGVVERDAAGRAPFAEFELIRQARLGALRLPRPSGGGARLTELFAVVIDLATADPNVAHSLRNHFNFLEGLSRREDPANEWFFDRARRGELFGTSGSEPNRKPAGGRVQEYETTLTRTADGLRLTGEKIYSTGNLYADWLVVSAKDDDGNASRVVVAGNAPGVIHVDDWDGIGQRFTGSGTTRFENVAVDEDKFLAGGTAWGDLPYIGTFPQLYLTAVIAGILRRVTRDAVSLIHGKTRTYYHAVAERPSDDPILQQSVGLLASQAYAAEALVLTSAAALEAATEASGTVDEHALSLRAAVRAAQAKVVVDELAHRAASDLFDVGGGSAVRQSAHLDRHWRNIRTIAAHNPKTFKAKWIGDHEINGTPLPNGAFF